MKELIKKDAGYVIIYLWSLYAYGYTSHLNITYLIVIFMLINIYTVMKLIKTISKK